MTGAYLDKRQRGALAGWGPSEGVTATSPRRPAPHGVLASVFLFCVYSGDSTLLLPDIAKNLFFCSRFS
jgi:hypothetical protein